MSGFGSLYYTDCLPGQGLQGGAGFQFQAASPGVATEAMALVQRSALYEPPPAWMRDRRPVADYPPSLAHTAEGGVFATSTGRYLGQEANGTRQGNQFTHAVVTRRPADYGLVRPAQMWGAEWWAVEPAPGTELALLPANPTPGPLDTETVRDRVRAVPDGAARLVALLSAVHHLAHTDNRRGVVLVSADPEVAACWIAAVTLLLPRPDALRTSFKIFVADPQYGRHDIIALHPEWAGRWADTGSGSGLAVFDLDQGRHGAVEPTVSAQFWVPRFLDGDAYDVVDAIELAGQFAHARAADEPGAPTEPSDADRLVALVVAAGERLSDPDRRRMAADWLRTAPEEAIVIARDTVLDAVLEASPDAPLLRMLAEAAGSRGWEEAAARIQRGLLTDEIKEVLAAPDGLVALRTLNSFPKIELLRRPVEDREHGRAEVETTLRVAHADQVPALFTVAKRHGVRVSPPSVQDPVDRFAAWWLARPEPEFEPGRWPSPPEALDWVRAALRRALAGQDRWVAAEAVRDRWWRHLWKEAVNPVDPLDALLMSTAYANLPESPRENLMGVVLGQTARMGGGDRPSTVACDILFGQRSPTVPEARQFVDGLAAHQMPMSGDVAFWLCTVLDAQKHVSADDLWINYQILDQGHPLSKVQARWRERDDAVRVLIQDLIAEPPTRTSADLAAALTAAAGPIIELRVEMIVDTLLVAPRDTALAVLRICTWEEAALPICQEFERRWPQPSSPATDEQCQAAAFVFQLVTGEGASKQRRAHFDVLGSRLAVVVAKRPKHDRVAIHRLNPDGLDEQWRRWLAENEPSRIKRSLGRVADVFSARPSDRGE
ncbi:MAG: hypothetical protein ACRDRH_19400 [Pseudonocardia sp.]